MKVSELFKLIASAAVSVVCLGFGSMVSAEEAPHDPLIRFGQNLVVGNDDRGPLNSRSYPWSAIGRLDVNGRHRCTATLVGTDLVLTNAHCVTDNSGTFTQGLRFRPNVIDNTSEYDIGVAHGWWGTPARPGPDDWAILRLRTPIGERVGYFGFKSPTPTTLSSSSWRNRLILAGYSGDFYRNTPGVHYGCSILNERHHDCDTYYGASGSAIFGFFSGQPHIVALHYGNTGVYNNYIHPQKYTARISELRRNDRGKPNRTYILLCNRSNSNQIDGAIAYYDQSWRTRGWYKIAKDTCTEVSIPVDRLYDGNVYIYGKDNSGLVWRGGNNNFCVDTQAFHVTNADRGCPTGNNYSFVRFSRPVKVNPHRLNSYNFNP